LIEKVKEDDQGFGVGVLDRRGRISAFRLRDRVGQLVRDRETKVDVFSGAPLRIEEIKSVNETLA
jgi:hypothetical protein